MSPLPNELHEFVTCVRYRFRLVSLSCQPNWKFAIDNHTMTIIEVEGTNVQPLEVDQIQIFAGQRYSFVVSTYMKFHITPMPEH